MSKDNDFFLTINRAQLISIIIDTRLHIHAQRLLRQYFNQFNLQFIDINDYRYNQSALNNSHLVIWVLDTNKLQSYEFLDRHLLNENLPDGAFIIRTNQLNQKPLLQIYGGGISGIIYAINEFGLTFLKCQDNSAFIPSMNIHRSPTSPYRFFWTWDHSTNWYLEQIGMQEIGFANSYTKPKNGFFEDYCRLIDFMSLHRINGITIYGFLRDCHGGIESAQAICQYAAERGVRIMPGIGINCYGGIYWEGEHPYNLTHWLRKNPELRAEFKQPKYFNLPDFAELYLPDTFYLDAACPSKSKNINYHIEAIQWLVETFQIGGINFETGDYGTCQCQECKTRRENDTQWSIRDMALLYPKLFSAATQKNHDLWLVCEAYWDNLLDPKAIAPLSELPDEAIYQFCTNRGYVKRLEKELTSSYVKNLPRSKNIWRTHMGSQWQQERYSLVADRYASLMRLSHKTGLKGGTIFAESSAFNTVNEINYLAFSCFGYNGTLTWEQFVENNVASLIGGKEEAYCYLELLNCESSINALKKGIGTAREIAANLTNDSYRRWIWLQNRLYQKLEML